MACPHRTNPEYIKLLDLANGSIIIVDTVWDKLDGKVSHITTKAELYAALTKVSIESQKIKKEEAAPFKEMEELNPTFIFKSVERNEITEALLHLSVLDSEGNVLSKSEVDSNLSLNNLKASIEQLSKDNPNYSDNYNKLLKPRVLEEFRLLVKDQIKALDPDLATNEDIEEDVKNNNSNFADSNLTDYVKKASANAKLLIRFLPSGKRGGTLGLPIYSNHVNSENLILDALRDIPNRGPERIDIILQRIRSLAINKPEFGTLLTKLESLTNTDRTWFAPGLVQFVKTFDKNAESYTSSFLEENDNGSYTNKIGSAETNSRDKVLIARWSNAFEEQFYSETDNGVIIFNKAKAQTLVDDYKKISDIRKKTTAITPEVVSEMISLYKRFGIELDEYVITNAENPLDSYLNLLTSLNKLVVKSGSSSSSLTELIEKKDFGNSSQRTTLETPIRDNSSLLNPLAKIQTLYMSDMTGNTVWGGGKMYQKYVLYNYLKLIQLDLNQGTNSHHLAMLDRDVYNTNSRWKDAIKEGAKIEFHLFNARKLAGSESKDSGEISYIDEFADRIERTLSGRAIFLTLADKGRMYDITGMPFINVSNKELNEPTVDIFTNYFFDELLTMQKAWDNLYGENPIDDKDKIEYYHTKGNVFKSTIFPSLSPNGELTKELENKGIEIYQRHADTGKPFSITPTNIDLNENGEIVLEEGLRDRLRPYIKQLLQKKIEDNKAQILADGLITDKGSVLDSTIVSKYLSGEFNKEELADKIATAFTINSLSNNIEQTKLFTGDPRMYKNIEDFLKRTPAVSATGDTLLVGGNVRPKFNVAVIKGFEAPSDFYTNTANIEQMMQFSGSPVAIAKSLNLIPYDSSAPTTANPIVGFDGTQWMPHPTKKNPYSKVNSTDAQAWISMNRFKEIVSGLEGWSEETEAAFQRIKNGNATKDDYNLFTNKHSSMQPKKGMHYELVEKEGKLVPVYLKYSQSVLFPEIVAGNPALQRMVELMGDNIDEVVVTDGIKVGAFGVTDMTLDNAKLNSIELSNQYWKLQQDLPNEGIKEDKLVLSQPKKNIIADINLDAEYFPGVKGADLVNELHEVDATLSDIGLAKLRNSLMTDGKISMNKVREKLIAEFKAEGESLDLIRALEDGIDLDVLPSYRRSINSKIANWYTKNAVKLKQFGGSGIQMSDLGFGSYKNEEGRYKRDNELTSEEKKGILWLKKDIDTLSPPIVEADKDGNYTVYKPGQILLNYKFAADFIPNFEKIKNDPDKLRAAIDEDLLKIVSARVPNQKISFNDSLEVVGFLPPHIGDTVIAYKEITTKTGSDFDIDKLYFMIPNYRFEPKTGRLEYIKYYDDSNSTVQERYDRYLNGIKKSKQVKKILADAGIDKWDAYALKSVYESLRNINENEDNQLLNDLKKALSYELTEEELNDILLEEDLATSFEEFNSKSVMLQNSKKAIENRRIELYRQVLEHPSTMSRLISAVDSNWLKDFIDDIIPSNKINDLDLYDGYFQMMKRREFLSSKGSVGQVANHVSDHALSQQAEIFLDVALGIGNTTGSLMDLSKSFTNNFETYNEGKIQSSERILITEVLSVFMNAFVDAAKDNYIGRANFNSTTNNVAFMLMRAGISPHFTVALLSQPIIKEYVKRMDANRGFITDKTSKNQLIANLAKDLGFEDGLPEVNSNLEEFTTDQLVANIKGTTNLLDLKGTDEGVKQVQLLAIFTQTLEPASRDLAKTIAASTADREGNGANIIDANIRKNNILAAMVSPTVHNFGNKLSKDGKRKMLGAAIDNSINSFTNDMGNTFLENTPGFNAILNEIYRRLFNKIPDKIDTANKISKLVYGTLMHQLSGFGVDKNKLNELLIGTDKVSNLATRLKSLKGKGYGNSNQLIDFLDFNINYSKKSPSFIAINNTKTLTPKVKEMLTYSWLEMYYNKDKNLREFAKDLAHYSFYNSLFSDNLTSFYRLLPYEISRDLGISNELSTELRTFLSSSDPSNYEKIIDNVLRNSLTDSLMTTKVSKKAVFKSFKVKGYKTLTPNSLYKIINTKEAAQLITNIEDGQSYYKPYITVNETVGLHPNTYQKPMYYEFIGTVNNDEGNSYPFYLQVNKLGYKRGVNQVYEIDLSDKPKSIINSNNVNISKEVRDNIESFISNHVESSDISIETITPVTSIIEATDVTSTNPIQPTSVSKEVKPGVAELFEYNPELTNEVYEVLGFGQESNLSEKNIFTVEPIQSVDKKAKSKAKIATQYIGFAEGVAGSSTALYARQISGQSKKISAKGKMTFAYGNSKRNDIQSNTTFEAIKNGERTATTRYESDGHIDYWKKLREGDIIEWESSTGENILVEVTKPLHKLVGSNKTAEQWSKLEGWSVDYFNSKVKPKLNEAWQIEYKVISNNSNIVNSGNYSSSDTIFVSVGGKRGNETVRKAQQDKTIKEAIKAIEAGATLVTDNAAYVESNSYNEGEKRLAANLKAKGYNYSETTVDGNVLGVWNKNTNQITPQQKQQAQQIYSQYLNAIFPDSKVKDIVYHHSSQKLEKFDKSFLGKETSAPDTQLGFFFAEDKNDIPKMVVEKNKQLEEIGTDKRLNFSVQHNVLLNIKNPEFYYGFIEEAISNILGRESRITDTTAKEDYKEAKLKLEQDNKDSLIYGLTIEPDGEGGTDVNKGYVIFEPEQIHILGSKQDIEGFKKFVGKSTTQPSTKGSSLLFNALANQELDNTHNNIKNDLETLGIVVPKDSTPDEIIELYKKYCKGK